MLNHSLLLVVVCEGKMAGDPEYTPTYVQGTTTLEDVI